MSYIYIECEGQAYKDMLDFVNNYCDNDGGEKGFKSYIFAHDKEGFIESVAEQLKENKK